MTQWTENFVFTILFLLYTKVKHHIFPQIILLCDKKKTFKTNKNLNNKLPSADTWKWHCLFSWVLKRNLIKKSHGHVLISGKNHWYARMLNVFTYILKLKYFLNLDLWDEILINLNLRILANLWFLERSEIDVFLKWIWSLFNETTWSTE